MQETAVSLDQRVAAQALYPVRTRGSEFAFEKCRPNSCNLKLPLELYAAPAFVSATTGSGYEYWQEDRKWMPELNAATVWLRPHPDELSVPETFW